MMVVEQTKIGGVTTLRTRRAGFDGSTSLNRAEPEPEPETEPGNHSALERCFSFRLRRRRAASRCSRDACANLDRCRLVEESVMIRGDVQNIFAVWKALDVADVVVMNLPIVA